MTQFFFNIRVLVLSLLVLSSVAVQSQSGGLSIEQEYDILTEKWLEVSKELKSYSGLSGFCVQPEFRNHAVGMLKQLHHYDSVVLEFLYDPATEILIGHHEYKVIMHEISSFETKYGIKSFLDFLRESCVTRNDLEKNKKTLELESGMYSYDGQIAVLEADITKFLHHIDKRVVSIDKHLHRIHPDRFQFEGSLTKVE